MKIEGKKYGLEGIELKDNFTQRDLENYFKHLRELAADPGNESVPEYSGKAVEAARRAEIIKGLDGLDIGDLDPRGVLVIQRAISRAVADALTIDPN